MNNTRRSSFFEYPFGAESCEQEHEILQSHYREYFYDKSRFNAEALEKGTYLIVGRRGTGKTSLSRYFEFQGEIPRARSILVEVQEIYNTLERKFENRAYLNPDLAIADIYRVWELLFWLLVFSEYYEKDETIAKTFYQITGVDTPRRNAPDIFLCISNIYINSRGEVTNELFQVLSSREVEDAKEAVLQYTHEEPLILAVDTYERYDRENNVMMSITAALIQCAGDFNVRYARQGIHIKAFISAEIFPYIKEEKIPNTTKYIRGPVYMNWRPKDLVRFITWRFKKSMAYEGHTIGTAKVDWEDFNEIRARLWNPFFGETVTNLRGKPEESLTYILRHTQMRPRQLVVLCNAIAREARNKGDYPRFKDVPIPNIIAAAENDLADEVLNSYHRVYPRVSEIITALRGLPALFRGNTIDQVAKKTAGSWLHGTYTAAGFRKLVAELGIVGEVRQKDERTGIIEANFEYAMDNRLVIHDDKEYVIHPMFYTKLQIERVHPWIVYPFPDHPEYDMLRKK